MIVYNNLFKKLFSAIFLCGVLTACGGEKPASSENESIQNASDSNQKHATTLKVAVNQDMPPFVFLDEKGNFIGIDVDVIRRIGDEMGFGVDFHPMPWKELFSSVEAGKYDLAIAGISYSDDREIQHGLTKSYLHVPSAIVYREDNPKFFNKNISSLLDLKGAKVGGMEIAKQVKQMEAIGGYESMKHTDTSYLAFKEVVQGKIDATFEDRQLLQYYIQNHADLGVKLRIVDYENEQNPEARQVIMVAKKNQELLAKLNQGIDKLIASGEIKRIEQKWLQ
ncbi:substrate-binding periplasmic protein [Moraxella equi]|uniref:Probable amino-acid ABC transporter-binding protein HI_1080 n=1 Tax=Moraxella equi TaxID=60442 RepID=A0A378QM39_9GAMM|nr:transporter substrate-binding domain-containing protein [Moraxella equi]OPH40250.1 hypothetical protein B5J93_00050 [Moraxella equi]STZ01905.1 Probable amino-acid ABC transporter-binding protein HI_1080 precursor [Moraxella equi]